MSSSPHFSVTLRSVSVSRPDKPILVDVDLTFTERSRVAVVGPNGIGKSTLLRVIAGEHPPENGVVQRAPADVTVGLLDQELDRTVASTVRELIAARLGITAAETELARASAALVDDHHEAADAYERALARFLALGAADLDSRLDRVCDDLALERRLLDVDPRVLSGGEAERVGLAIVMLSRFDLTLLDEPTNNLDRHGLHMLEEWVDAHDGALVLVSHDRTFLERTVRSVVEIDERHHTVREFAGGWDAYVVERSRAAALEAERHADYVSERGRLSARSQRQREWADQGASRARKQPSDPDKFVRNHNIAQTEKLAAKAKASRRAIDRLEEVEAPWRPWELRFTIEQAPRSADVVASFEGAVLAAGDFRLGPVDLEIRWGERIVLVGANGSGKTTLLEAMLGRLAPAAGTVRLGSGVIVGELGQGRTEFASGGEAVGPAPSLARAFQDAGGLTVAEARSVLAKFGLDATAVERPASSLSPGERTRARLALFQATEVNFLVLDEPTNHLDIAAIEQLESALASFDGTLLLVSHDRRLLENVETTRTIEIDPFGAVG